MDDALRAKRWTDFQSRVRGCRENAAGGALPVYRHRTRGWEYVPIHPFADEPEVLARLRLRPDECRVADAWWGIDGDATLLQLGVVGVLPGPARLLARPTPHEERWVYLVAVVDAPFVTREAFEAAMVRFAEAGFPSGALFQLQWGDRPVQVPEVPEDGHGAAPSPADM
jgi:hypothetical protein